MRVLVGLASWRLDRVNRRRRMVPGIWFIGVLETGTRGLERGVVGTGSYLLRQCEMGLTRTDHWLMFTVLVSPPPCQTATATAPGHAMIITGLP